MEIKLEDIKQFSKEYNSNPINKIIENSIIENGIENTCINRKIVIENQPVFNIELPESTRYDQKNSAKCWIYAGFNMIKYNIAKNLNIDVKDLKLSTNYISFFDRLEKSNYTYDNIINLKEPTISYMIKDEVLEECVCEGGYWDWFVGLVNKYGIIPYTYMPDGKEATRAAKITGIYYRKVKKDVLELLEMRNSNASLEELEDKKKIYLQENYNILSKILGEPITKFTYEYKDKDNKIHMYKNMTPLEFKNKFLTINLEDFVSVANIPMYNKEYYKKYKKKYSKIIKDVEFLNLPIEELKKFAVEQLKDNLPVWFSMNMDKDRDVVSGILDERIFNLNNVFNLKNMTKEELANVGEISAEHAMVFSGVHLIDDKPIRWKVEDSYGDKTKINGYYVMNDNFFEKYVLQIIVDKKYLSDEQKRLLEQEAIEYDEEIY